MPVTTGDHAEQTTKTKTKLNLFVTHLVKKNNNNPYLIYFYKISRKKQLLLLKSANFSMPSTQ